TRQTESPPVTGLAPVLVDLPAMLDPRTALGWLLRLRGGRTHRPGERDGHDAFEDSAPHAFDSRICLGQMPPRPAAMIPFGSTASFSVSQNRRRAWSLKE